VKCVIYCMNFRTGTKIFCGVLITLLSLGSLLYYFFPSVTIAVFLYYTLRPVNTRIHSRYIQLSTYIEQYISTSRLHSFLQSQKISAFTTAFVAVVPSLLFLSYLLSLVISEAQRLIDTFNIPLSQLVNTYLGISIVFDRSGLEALFQQQEFSAETVQQLVETSLYFTTTLSDGFLQLLVGITFVYVLLVYDTRIKNWLSNSVNTSEQTLESWNRIDKRLSSIYLGNILNSIVTALLGIIIYSIFFQLSELSFSAPVILGILVGIGSIIPVVGIKLVYGSVGAYIGAELYIEETFNLFPDLGVFFLLSIVFIDFIPDTFLRPYFSSKRVFMALLLLAYLVGTVALGVSGFFISPVVLVLFLYFYEEQFPQLYQELFSDETNS